MNKENIIVDNSIQIHEVKKNLKKITEAKAITYTRAHTHTHTRTHARTHAARACTHTHNGRNIR